MEKPEALVRLGCGRWAGYRWGRVPASLALLMAFGVVTPQLGTRWTQPRSGTSGISHNNPAGVSPRVPSTFAHVPLSFEPNQGQSDPQVRFLARGSGFGLYLTKDEAVLALQHSVVSHRHSVQKLSVLSMRLTNANPNADMTGNDQLPGKSNYFIGNDPRKWHHDIPQYARVRYSNVYPGIDLVYYGNRGRLEYDFEVAPGGDATQLAFAFKGAGRATIDSNGDLVLTMDGGSVRLQSPRVYQKFADGERQVAGRFKLRGAGKVGFELGAYDHSRTLIIDPVLTYSTYLGGSGDEACSATTILGVVTAGCPSIAVDTGSNAYVAGATTSTDFPKAGSPFQTTLKGTANVFVSKFDPTGETLLFSTYLGGSKTDTPAGIAVDTAFNVIVTGNTSSGNFPTSSSAFQTTPVNTSNKHAFVSKLDPTGHTLLYSTYLSGSGLDTSTGVAVDPSANIYVTGTTTSTEVDTGFPSTINGFQTSSKAASQFFLTKLNPTLSGSSSVPYSTYIGGSTPSNGETLGGGVAVDTNTNVYVAGGTNFTDMPLLNAFQGTMKGTSNVYVMKINPAPVTGAQLQYATYLGGTGQDIAYGIAVDSSFSAYVTGSTTSTDFPEAGTGVFQSTNGGGTDAFLAKLGTPATTGGVADVVPLDYFTYIGGSGTDVGLGVAVDGIQGARITGWTNSPNFPVLNTPVQGGFGGGASDAFVARIDTTATIATAPGHYATYLGGTGNDYGTGIAVDLQGASYVAGETTSADLLTIAAPLNPSFQPNLNGSSDAFVSKLGPLQSLGLAVIASPTPVGVGNQVSFVYTVTNNGDFTNGVSFTDFLPPSTTASYVSASSSTSANGCGAPSGGTVLCNIGSLNAEATATVTVILTPVAGTTPATNSVSMSNNASVSVAGCSTAACNPQANTTVTVNDFKIGVAPATATVAAGVPATYTATVTPTGNIPSSVTISCNSGSLPTGATCTVTTNPIPNLDNGPASTLLVISTTARVTTTTRWWQPGGPIYATWLPLSGVALLGVGIGKVSRRRRVLMGLLLTGFFSLIFLQVGCGSKAAVTTTSGTPAGTYVVTVTATSGTSATRSTTVTLVVQ